MKKMPFLLVFILSSFFIFSDTGEGLFAQAASETKVSKELQEKQDNFEVFRLDHNMEVFKWEMFSTKIMFWLSISLVLTGIVLSILQFAKSIETSKLPDNSETTLIISEKGVKIKTAFIGLIILIISFAYLYLYMEAAYPIKYLNKDFTYSIPEEKNKN